MFRSEFRRHWPGVSLQALALLISLFQVDLARADDPPRGWVLDKILPAAEARQAAAADTDFVYVIDNTLVAKYDRNSGQRIGNSLGDAQHLNSGFLLGRKLYSAHSNYPAKPEQSEIKVLNLDTLELTRFHSFGESGLGSLTVAVLEQGVWWCVFAHYGEENHRTSLVRFDEQWNVSGSWSFPVSVIEDLGKYSISGGIWQNGQFLATGHDKKVVYLLELTSDGTRLKHVATVPSPFPGQGIAEDPVTGGLIGIDRKRREVVFAVRAKLP